MSMVEFFIATAEDAIGLSYELSTLRALNEDPSA
jgi:hypothetical protein